MALFNLAYARKTGGQFVLRIEDTDRNRYIEGSEKQIFELLRWLGLPWDEGPDVGGPYAPYRQSERLETYKPFVDKLIADGHAYYCWCSQERLAKLREEQQASKQSKTGYDRLCYGMSREEREKLPGFTPTPVVRMLVPEDIELTFTDLIRGEISAPMPDDQVILKADGFPTYHMAVVVDDHLMGITHVVRGEEWISSTPKHLQLYKWLGLTPPQFAHMPLLRNTDHSKISKRKNPAARLAWFREQGYLPEALRNFLQLLGYPPADDDHEISSFDDFVENFDWAKVSTVGPVFDLKKLDWMNGFYIRSLEPAQLAERIIEHLQWTGQWPTPADPQKAKLLTDAVPIIQERLVTLNDALPKLGFLFTADDQIVIEDDARKTLPENWKEVVSAAIDALDGLESFSAEAIQGILREKLVEGMGIKPKFAFGPVRVGITGQRVTPPLFESMELLGKASSLERLRRFVNE
jgi:glutamyl-tRNA synthetase